MRLIPAISWCTDAASGTRIDPRLLALLARIDRQGSLRAASDAIGMPYRTAWGMLHDIEQALGVPLVRLEKGHGAALTVHGTALLRADTTARQRLSRAFDALALELVTPEVRTRADAAPVLHLAASHDPALVALQDALPAAAGVRLEVGFCGSLEALARFQTGKVDLAGFHLVPGDKNAAQRFLRQLRPARDRLVHFVDREQGLIVARGNRHRIACLADVVTKRLRFVNRQTGSGTRLLIDAQLAREGLEARRLRGYSVEEYTHAAVAATIASHRADVGFGVAAAATEYGLGFVPLMRERYYFAVQAAMLEKAPIKALLEALVGPVFKGLVARMTGYDATHAGMVEQIGGRPARRKRRRTTGSVA